MRITPGHLANDIPAMQAMIDNHMQWVHECPEIYTSHATEHLFWMTRILHKAIDELRNLPDLDDFTRHQAETEYRKLTRAMSVLC